ncbi:hypothetical protein [Luteibaculum oceani]|nr:hypothetical protein [Luteibaculum oceani]
MKKAGLIFIAVALASFILSSCGAHKGCEAYSQVDVEKKEERV